MSKKNTEVTSIMETYIGTKVVKATPMSRSQYLNYRGWDLPDGEDPNDEVYLVEYQADPLSDPNHPDHDGYITMSPKHVFDKAYKSFDTPLQRMYIEENSLAEKLTGLEVFLTNEKRFEIAGKKQVELMEAQFSYMQAYSKILKERIELMS